MIVIWVKLYKILCTFTHILETFGEYCIVNTCDAELGDVDGPWWLVDLIFRYFMKRPVGIWLAGECSASERERMQFLVFKKYFRSIFGRKKWPR